MSNVDNNVISLEEKRRAMLDMATRLSKLEKEIDNTAGDVDINDPAERSEVANMTPGEIDAKIAQSKAETETSLAHAMGDVRVNHEALLGVLQVGFSDLRTELANVNGRLDHVEKSTSGMKTTILVTAIASSIAIFGAMIAVLAYGGQLFTAGLDTSAAAQKAADDVYQRVIQQQKQPQK